MSLPSSNAPATQPGSGPGDPGANAASPQAVRGHPEHVPASGHGQFALLGQRRFAPFFWVQFLGAGNDNLFKFAFTVLVTYQTGATTGLDPKLVVNLIAALFILPFLLFSATSGQLADKYDKAVLIRFVKSLEIAIMLLAGWGFMHQHVPVLLGCVFLMGLHSTLFGPVTGVRETRSASVALSSAWK